MSDRQNYGTVLERFRAELHKNVPLRPARVELEKRRLLAGIAAEPSKVSVLWPRLVFGIGMAAVAVFVFVFLFAGNRQIAEHPLVVSGLWRVETGSPLKRGHKFFVPPKSGAKVILADGTVLWLDSLSEVVSSNDRFTELEISKGRLLTLVSERSDEEPFCLRTPHGRVVVHGTVFSASIDAEGVWIRLYRGKVECEGLKESFFPAMGQQVRLVNGEVLSVSQIDRAAVIADLMIAEKTATLDGPHVPEILVPSGTMRKLPPTEGAPEPPAQLQSNTTRKRKRSKKSGVKSQLKTAYSPEKKDAGASKEILHPETEAIEIEYDGASQPIEEQLIERAYEKLKAGKHKEAREILKNYVELLPRAKHWQDMKNVLIE